MPQLVFSTDPARAPALTRSTINSGISRQRRADLARPPRGQPVSGRYAYMEWVRGWLWAQGLKGTSC